MKLLVTETRVDSSKTFQSQNFAIGDISVILEILRSKIYSNPIHIVCQEIMSNARDAHREIGKQDTPILVSFPNEFDDTLQIRDFGPGITPDRMANVFIQYGKSTKRDDNVQTGGFGLGAKTPFSYSDSFAIVSITPDEFGTMVRRQYVAYIDESRVGTMSMVSEDPTDEPQGTIIIITPKPGDISLFIKAAQKVSEYWDVKPKFLPENIITWPNRKVAYEGTGWKIYSDEKAPEIVIDGISYPLDKYIINASEYAGLLEKHLVMTFGIGELKITASREAIDYQPEVKQSINARLKLVVSEIKAQTAIHLAKATNLWTASIMWNELNKYFSLDIGEWNGHKIRRAIDIYSEYATVFKVTKDTNACDGIQIELMNKGGYHKTEIHFNQNTLLVEDDTGNKRPSRSRLITLFDQFKNHLQIFVVSPKNIKGIRTAADSRARLEEKCHFSLFEPVKLSTIPYRTIVRDPNAPRATVKVYKIRRLSERKEWEPCEDDTLTDPEGGIYVIKRGSQFISMPLVLNKSDIDSISDNIGEEIYYVLEKYVDQLGPKWVILNKSITMEIAALEADPDMAFCENSNHSSQIMQNKYHGLWEVINKQSFLNLLIFNDGVCMRYFKASQKYSDAATKIARLETLKRILDRNMAWTSTTTSTKMSDLSEEFGKTYPLLKVIDNWQVRNWSGILKELDYDIAMYINLKDGSNNVHQPHQNP